MDAQKSWFGFSCDWCCLCCAGCCGRGGLCFLDQSHSRPVEFTQFRFPGLVAGKLHEIAPFQKDAEALFLFGCEDFRRLEFVEKFLGGSFRCIFFMASSWGGRIISWMNTSTGLPVLLLAILILSFSGLVSLL